MRSGQARKHARDDRVSLLRARHRLDDVAIKRRMQIAEKADRASVGAYLGNDRRTLRLGEAANRMHRVPVFVPQLKILAIEMEVLRILSREDRIGLRSGRDQDRMRG